MQTADIVNTWFSERLATGALARDTEAYNQVRNALPDLIDRLGAAVPAQAEAPTDGAKPKKAGDATT